MLARIRSVFEPWRTTDHLEVVLVPCLDQAHRHRISFSLTQRDLMRLDLGDLGIGVRNSTRARTSLVPHKPLPSCDAFASDWSIPRTPGSVSSSHHPSPSEN